MMVIRSHTFGAESIAETRESNFEEVCMVAFDQNAWPAAK